MHFLAAAHHLAWIQYPALWLCESCAILWLAIRSFRSRMVHSGVLLMLFGLMLNALVTEVNAGRMPVVGMPSTLHPMNSTWQPATSNTRLAFLADQARLGMFSVGDLALVGGGIFVLAICAQRILRMRFGLNILMSELVSPVWISGNAPLDVRIPRGRKRAVTVNP